MPQPQVQAGRRYLWRGAGDVVEVLFEDGVPFHSYGMADPAPSATHYCAPDIYVVDYTFIHWPGWSATWKVTGPRKDYVSVARYQQSAPGADI